jgi:hypothetical protein
MRPMIKPNPVSEPEPVRERGVCTPLSRTGSNIRIRGFKDKKEGTMRCKALDCVADTISDGVCEWTCAAHQDFFRFETWIKSFGPRAYNHSDLPTRTYIDHCLLHYVREIRPDQVHAMYFVNRDAFDFDYEEGEGILASYLLDYCRLLFRRPDVSPTWNKNLFHILVKQVLLNCLPHRLGSLEEELATFVRHPLVGGADVLEVLARLRHSQPSPFALLCSREAWQDILEALVVPELVGVVGWAGTTEETIRAWGTAAVEGAVAHVEGGSRALAQWRYETEPFLLDYCRLCRLQAAERFESLRDELMGTALHPDRGMASLLDGEGVATWTKNSVVE